MHGDAQVMGLGQKTSFAGLPLGSTITHLEQGKDRTIVLSTRGGDGVLHARAFDFSGLSGAPALLVAVQGEPIKAPRDDLTDGQRGELNRILSRSSRPKPKPGGGKPGIDRAQLTCGGLAFSLLTLHRGQAPKARVLGQGKAQHIVVGTRTVTFDGGRIVLGQ